MKAHIITIGDELLIGQIIDTNSAFMAQQLNNIGVEVAFKSTISDDRNSIVEALEWSMSKADVVLMTGGLGPTNDDITKHVLAEFFHGELKEDAKVLAHIQNLLEPRGITVSDSNRAQALVPDCCEVIENKMGTAPGMWFEEDGKIVVSMPGVPFEMKDLMKKSIIPRLSNRNGNNSIFHKTVLTQGLPESMLAQKIESWENQLPSNIKLAYLPNPMAIKLRLSAYGNSLDDLKRMVAEEIEKLKELIEKNIFGYDNDTLAGVIGKTLVERGETMATAESCTGGNIAHQVTLNAGSSAYFKGGVVAYSNEVKEQQLLVSSADLEAHGAVSQPVVEAMAKGVAKVLHTTYGVATSGIAGPAGGSEDKPVGTVWIAVAKGERVISKKYNFGTNRERNITRSTQTALNMLRQLILENS
ncbi:competence/damage-inducible protein A [Prolixibacteraceae bacterium JC049]|nr:competence/damage-inducible protein A [Prolixibacteraceae bacterium JC049]